MSLPAILSHRMRTSVKQTSKLYYFVTLNKHLDVYVGVKPTVFTI